MLVARLIWVRRDSSLAGRKFDPYTANHISQQLLHLFPAVEAGQATSTDPLKWIPEKSKTALQTPSNPVGDTAYCMTKVLRESRRDSLK